MGEVICLADRQKAERKTEGPKAKVLPFRSRPEPVINLIAPFIAAGMIMCFIPVIAASMFARSSE
jgi:hypothetical protein